MEDTTGLSPVIRMGVRVQIPPSAQARLMECRHAGLRNQYPIGCSGSNPESGTSEKIKEENVKNIFYTCFFIRIKLL